MAPRPVTKTCAQCGKTLRLNRSKYCNYYCFGDSNRGTKKSQATRKAMSLGRVGMKLSKTHIENIRLAKEGKPHPMLGKTHTLEAREKISLGLKGKMGGDKHWNWQGGKRGLDYRERRKFQKTIQKTVFERDNYTCQLCSQLGGSLQVDHIQSWADYIELRFCIDNCRTLCMACHYFITYGKPMSPSVRTWGHNMIKGGTKS